MLNDLGIYGCDEYELLVIEFLQSGLFDPSAVAAIIDRYAEENDVMIARNDLKEFLERVIWDHRLTEADLLTEAKNLVPRVHLLDVYDITSLYDAVEELAGGVDIAKAMLDSWIAAFKAKSFDDFDDENLFERKVHPAIQAEFDAIKTNAQAKLTVFEACEFIAKNSGWNTRQELAMKAATVANFETVIKSINIKDLQMFMRQMLRMTLQSGSYREHFGHTTDRFVQACKNIAEDPNSGRLGKSITTLFDDSKLRHLVNPSVGAVEEPDT